MRLMSGFLGLFLLGTVALSGCASHEHEVRHERVVTTDDGTEYGRGRRESRVVVEKESHVHDDDDHGVISTLVSGVGEIIALPFRLVGGLLDALF